LWGEEFAPIGGDLPNPNGIAVDKQGNTYVIGYLPGTLTFGQADGGTVTATCGYYLASFDKTGAYRWATAIDSINPGTQCITEDPDALAVDAQGNVYFAGEMSVPSVTLGGTKYMNPGGMAVLLVSYTSTGALRWAQVYPGGYPTAMGVDSKGALIVVGAGTPAFPGPVVTGTMFLGKLDSATGHAMWGTNYWGGTGYGDTSSQPTPTGLAITSSDDVLVTGTFVGTFKLDMMTSIVSAGQSDIFLAKIYTGGTFGPSVVWANRYGGAKSDYGDGVAVDPSDAILLVGKIGGPADLGSGSTVVVTPASFALDGFVAKYDAMGTYQWAKTFGGTAGVTSQSQVTSNANSEVIITGAGAGSFNFGGGMTLLPAGNNPNVFLAELDAKGSYGWAKLFGDMSGQQYPVVATDPSNQQIVLAFANQGTVNLGKNMLTAAAQSVDLVLARFTP
jgi:hypothetical protein